MKLKDLIEQLNELLKETGDHVLQLPDGTLDFEHDDTDNICD